MSILTGKTSFSRLSPKYFVSGSLFRIFHVFHFSPGNQVIVLAVFTSLPFQGYCELEGAVLINQTNHAYNHVCPFSHKRCPRTTQSRRTCGVDTRRQLHENIIRENPRGRCARSDQRSRYKIFAVRGITLQLWCLQRQKTGLIRAEILRKFPENVDFFEVPETFY